MDVTSNKYIKWALVIAIVIVLNLFFNFALKVVYSEPNFNDFCPEKQVIERVETQEVCLEQGGQWNENIKTRFEGEPIPTNISNGFCNLSFECRNNYEEADKDFERKVFTTLIALGVISIIISFLIIGTPIVSTAFAFGGVLTFVWSSMRYWRFASEILQVVILGIALLALIYLGVKKFK